MYDKDAANANARLSTQLPYIFAVSRFAHYLKAMMRDKIGSFMSRADCETFLNQWILQLRDAATTTRRRRSRRSTRCARRGSKWSKFPASRASIAPWRS